MHRDLTGESEKSNLSLTAQRWAMGTPPRQRPQPGATKNQGLLYWGVPYTPLPLERSRGTQPLQRGDGDGGRTGVWDVLQG